MRASLIPLLVATGLLGGCQSDGSFSISLGQPTNTITETAALTDPQACAVGYDLARAIYDNLPAGRSDIVIREGQGPCERYAVEYLRRAGFAIRKVGGAPFLVETRPLGANAVLAIGRIGDQHTVSRLYELGEGGVYAAGPASFQKIIGATEPVRSSRRSQSALQPIVVRGDR